MKAIVFTNPKGYFVGGETPVVCPIAVLPSRVPGARWEKHDIGGGIVQWRLRDLTGTWFDPELGRVTHDRELSETREGKGRWNLFWTAHVAFDHVGRYRAARQARVEVEQKFLRVGARVQEAWQDYFEKCEQRWEGRNP